MRAAVARLTVSALVIGGLVSIGSPVSAGVTVGRIAFTRFSSAGAGVYTSNPDGSDRELVVSLEGERESWGIGLLDISADGSMLALTLLPRSKGRIYIVNADGSNLHPITSGGDDRHPSFSPDGSQLVFSRDRNGRSSLFKIDSDGTDLLRLTGPAEPDAAFPSWSPDGTMIAFTSIGRLEQQVVVTEPTGTWFRFLLARPRRVGQLFSTAWSADSSTVAFAAYDRNFINADLWTVGADGKGLTQITDTPNVAEVNPAYAPDGSMIACSLQDPYGNFNDVLLMNADGSGRIRMRTAADEYHVSWGG